MVIRMQTNNRQSPADHEGPPCNWPCPPRLRPVQWDRRNTSNSSTMPAMFRRKHEGKPHAAGTCQRSTIHRSTKSTTATCQPRRGAATPLALPHTSVPYHTAQQGHSHLNFRRKQRKEKAASEDSRMTSLICSQKLQSRDIGTHGQVIDRHVDLSYFGKQKSSK